MTQILNAPPLACVREFLVYFRANKTTGLFPGSPFDLLNDKTNEHCLVLLDIASGQMQEFPINNHATFDTACDALFYPCFDWTAKVYTVHANSVVCRMARWRSLRTKRPLPHAFAAGTPVDLVDAVNRPAILTGAQRYSFKLSDYVEILGLLPDARFDRETGTLVDLSLRYGSNN